jgi:hypothetical protein
MTTAEEENKPHNRLELLSRTAAWRNVIEKSQEVVPDIASFPGRVTPAEPGVSFPDPSFGVRTVNSSSVYPWTAMRPVTRNAMSFDDGDSTPYRAFGTCSDQGNLPVAPLDIANSSIQANNLTLENNQQSQDMLRPKPVASFARSNPSLPSARHSGLSTQAAFAPPRSRVCTDPNHPSASVTSNTSMSNTNRPLSRQAGSPPSLQSQFFQGYAPEGGYLYSSNSGCTLRPTPAHSLASPWISHAPPPNYHGGHGGYATSSSSSEGASYRDLADENAKLRHQVHQKDASVAALEAKVRHLEKQIGELRELPTGKISHIPIEYVFRVSWNKLFCGRIQSLVLVLTHSFCFPLYLSETCSLLWRNTGRKPPRPVFRVDARQPMSRSLLSFANSVGGIPTFWNSFRSDKVNGFRT